MSISGNWDSRISRRTFIGLGEMSAAAVSEYAVGIGPYKRDVDAALVEAAHERCLAAQAYETCRSGL